MLSIVVPVRGRTDVDLPCIASLITTMQEPASAELVLVDDGSDAGGWLQARLRGLAGRTMLVRHAECKGQPAACNTGLHASSGDAIVFAHSDVLMLEFGWDWKLRNLLGSNGVGLVGLHGASRAHENGGRDDCYSNMLEAEAHGRRHTGFRPIVLLDGFFIAGKRNVVEPGWDAPAYVGHHFVDKDICMRVHHSGLRNYLLGLRCHHFGGSTSTKYDETGNHAENERRYLARWKERLPTWV